MDTEATIKILVEAVAGISWGTLSLFQLHIEGWLIHWMEHAVWPG